MAVVLAILGCMDRTFRTIAETVVPEAAELDEAGWLAFGAIVEHAIGQRPVKMQRQLAVFVKLLNAMSIARYRRPLHRLDASVRKQFLTNIQNSKVMLLRRGFWGIRTLILMGYYARPEARQLIGYSAHARGWEMRA